MKKFLCLIAMLALIGPCFAKPIRIMVFGDSLSWGFIYTIQYESSDKYDFSFRLLRPRILP